MFNPIEASRSIKQSFVDYVSTSLSIADPHYRELFRNALSEDGVMAKGPYVDIGGSYETGKSLRDLIDEGAVSKLFETLENVSEKKKEIKLDRPLYSHQEEALRRTLDNANIVITTGTGSGKTECFLLPMLHLLLEEKKAKRLTNAVRAIIIYPMNALANDQMKRLRNVLATCPEITFGIYTGTTKHLQESAFADYQSLYKTNPLPNERISREAMQNAPPHILITNYSMLEHMMLRPKDDAVFSGANLRYLILDEAHIYRGATGIEMALLMRRLRARISNPDAVQYILTSATLGGENENENIIQFATNLCGAQFAPSDIIRSTEILQPMIEYNDYPPELFKELYAGIRPVTEILKNYNADYAPQGDNSEKIYELLLRSRLFGKFMKVASKTKTVFQIADEIGISRDSLVHLIATSAKAIKQGTSLIKVRYHFFIRSLEGVYVTLMGDRELFLIRKEFDDNGAAVFECGICRDCGRLVIASKFQNGRLLHPVPDDGKPIDYFLIKEQGEANFYTTDDEEETSDSMGPNDYLLCPICGAADTERTAIHRRLCNHNPVSYVKLRKAERLGTGDTRCPACEFGRLRNFYLGYEAITAVLATTLYETLPEFEMSIDPVNQPSNEFSRVFGLPRQSAVVPVERARQFLTFSDSRADAAFFAVYMEKSYEEFLRRRGLWQMCDNMRRKGRHLMTVKTAIDLLARLFESKGTFIKIGEEKESLTETCRRQAYITIVNELFSSRRATGLAQLGKLAFRYMPKDEEKQLRWEKAIQTISSGLPSSHNPDRDAEALMNLLILDVVYTGALKSSGSNRVELSGDEREYLFYTPAEKKIVKVKQKSAPNYQAGWLPRQRTGKTKSFYSNSRMTRLMRTMAMAPEEAWQFLDEFWADILLFVNEREYSLRTEDFDILLFRTGTTPTEHAFTLYRCEKCGRVTAFNCQGRCSNVKCSGVLKEFAPKFEDSGHHYVNLYSSQKMKPLYIKEHTAQLSRERGAQYQKLFIDKKLNVLSSSTTFEMGVDMGNLETVLLRNMPPTPANYIQRTGRAGRNLQSAAYALTFAKLSSHDFTYFRHPEDMISGQVKAPVFQLKNEKIIRRHINAVALSAFFAQHNEVYDNNNQSELLNSDGYEKLKRFLEAKPSYLKVRLSNSVPPGDYGIDDWSWTEHLVGENGILEIAVRDFRQTIVYLEQEINRAADEKNYRKAGSLENKLECFRASKQKNHASKQKNHKRLIDFLVRNNVLPKYGFPVDTVELLPDPFSARVENRPQMQRDLQLAIAEYAPGAEIVADGSLYTSRYIRRSLGRTSGNWEYGAFATCDNQDCGSENYYRDVMLDDMKCRSCGQVIGTSYKHKSIEPRQGFLAESKPKVVKMRKPERHYRTDDLYIGDPTREVIDKRRYQTGRHIIQIESSANDSLVVRTRTKFKICEYCGYATEKGGRFRKKHLDAFGNDCPNQREGLEFYLSHEFKTDVARITFETNAAADYHSMLSVLYSFLEAMSKELDIERSDIKGCLYKTGLGNGILGYNLIIYDSVAGGAGHARRLVTPDGVVLSRVIKRAVALMDGCDCEPSCYKCLRNYYNQKIHSKLNRINAADFLRPFFGTIRPLEQTRNEFAR